MNFLFSEEQDALEGLARDVFGDRATHERLVELESQADAVVDRDLWQHLADAGILGTLVPEAYGGAGLGLLELLPVLEQAGRHVAPVPLVPTLVTGVLPLIDHADDDVQQAWLPRVAAGEAVLTAALEADPDVPDGPAPVTVASEPGGWTLQGDRAFVPYAAEADAVLVPARSDHGTGLFLVERDDITVTPVVSTNRAPLGHLHLDAAPATALVAPGPDGAAAVQRTAHLGSAAWCAVQAGVCEGALRRMADHTSTRQQFGKPIAEFQAVSQRAADAFIDTQMVRLTAWQAVFHLAQGWEAAEQVHTAAFWAGEGAMRVVHAAQHVHGGLGVDLEYPLHRYFLWAKQIEHTLGTPTRELARLGDLLADRAA